MALAGVGGNPPHLYLKAFPLGVSELFKEERPGGGELSVLQSGAPVGSFGFRACDRQARRPKATPPPAPRNLGLEFSSTTCPALRYASTKHLSVFLVVNMLFSEVKRPLNRFD